jgi:hypothetical protein
MDRKPVVDSTGFFVERMGLARTLQGQFKGISKGRKRAF